MQEFLKGEDSQGRVPMSEKYLPVTLAVYEAVIELQKRLQDEYGGEVSIADTIDFLGHQSFIHQRLLDILSLVERERTGEQKDRRDMRDRQGPRLMEWLFGAVGQKLPQDSTCFIRTKVSVPLHWAGTRWLRDIEGMNIIACFMEPEGEKKRGHKIDID
jgi:hypothetical protein